MELRLLYKRGGQVALQTREAGGEWVDVLEVHEDEPGHSILADIERDDSGEETPK